MLRVNFAKSNIQLPAVGFGCLQMSMAAFTEDQANEMISQAYKQGVRVFDTAAIYGENGHNEKLLGAALNKLKDSMSEKPFIITKCGISFEDGGKFTQTPEQIRESVEKSLKNIGVDRIDLLYLHRADYNASADQFAKTIHTMKSLVKEGKVRYIGLSEPSAAQIKIASEVQPIDIRISSVEIAYSLFSRRAELNGVWEACQNLGITIVAYTSIVRGACDGRLLAMNEQDFTELSDDDFQKKIFNLLKIDPFTATVGFFDKSVIKENVKQLISFQNDARRFGVTPTQLALAWLAHRGVISIPGTTSVTHLKENTAVLNLEISPQELDNLTSKYPVGCFRGDPNPSLLSRLETPAVENCGLQCQASLFASSARVNSEQKGADNSLNYKKSPS